MTVTTDIPGINYSTTAASSVDNGYKILVKNTCTLISVMKVNGCGDTNALLLNSAKTQLASAAFTNNVATFNYNLVGNGTYYIVASSSLGSPNTLSSSGITYPIVGTNINFTGGVTNTTDNTSAYNIASVTTQTTRPTTGGPGSAAITNDDAYTYHEPDNGYSDYVGTTYNKVKDPRSY